MTYPFTDLCMNIIEKNNLKVIMVDGLLHSYFKQYAAFKNEFIQDLANEALTEKMRRDGYIINEHLNGNKIFSVVEKELVQ
jgi:hypothetical protein